MDNDVEKLIGLSGNVGRYQYFALIIAFLIWSISAFHSVSLPFLEKTSYIIYANENNETIHTDLNYEICEKYDYILDPDKPIEFSWVVDYQIQCDKEKVGLLGAFNYAGFTCGSFLFPFVSKIMTQKLIILIAMSIYCIFILLNTIFKNYYFSMISLLFLGICTNLSNYSSVTIVSESVSYTKRSVFSSIINIGFTFCALIFTPLFLLLHEWTYVFYCDIGISVIILIITFIILYNSPRTFLNKGETDKALKILKGIAKFNKKEEEFEKLILTEEYQQILKQFEENKEIKEINETSETNKQDEKNTKEKLGYSSLLKYKSIRYKFLIFCFLFFATSGIYNGISIGVKKMPGSIYVNMILLYVVEGVAYFSTGFIINSKILGRKKSLIIFFVFSAIGFLSYSILNKLVPDMWIPQFIVSIVIRFTISCSYTTYYTYILENYPTPIRSLGFGLNTTFGNIGGIISPLVIEVVRPSIMYFIFAGLCVINCLLIIPLPETQGKPMKETIDELEINQENTNEYNKEENLLPEQDNKPNDLALVNEDEDAGII